MRDICTNKLRWYVPRKRFVWLLSSALWLEACETNIQDHEPERSVAFGASASLGPQVGQDNGVLMRLRHEAGMVPQLTTVEHTFQIVNSFGSDLRIDDVRKSCTCTNVSILDDVVPPEGEAAVQVELATNNQYGTTGAIVWLDVTIGDGKKGEIALELSCDIHAPVEYYPAKIDFGQVASGERPKRSLYIWDTNGEMFKVLNVEAESPFWTFRIDDTSPTSGNRRGMRGWDITIEFANDPPVGDLNDVLIVSTTSLERPTLRIPMSGRVVGPIYAQPASVFWPHRGQQEAKKVTVTLRRRGDGSVDARSVSTDAQWLSARLRLPEQDKSDEGIVAFVDVRVKSRDSLTRGYHAGRVVIHTNSSDNPEMNIPVRLFSP